MAERIGFQDGIKGLMAWIRKQPDVTKRGPNYDPSNITTWPWPDKIERMLNMMKDTHDAAVTEDPRPNPPTPKPPDPPYPVRPMAAPQTINPEGGSDAKYCVKDLPWDRDRNCYYEPSNPGITYNSDGLCNGGRTNNRVIPGLRGSRSQDDADICGYVYQGKSYPPWPEESYLQ
jgi:hypothetical protein